jgi:hypothetical protein
MNRCEKETATALQEAGWNVLNNGWPDFICWRYAPDGTRTVVAVEVKSIRTKDVLRPNQVKNHELLKSIGLPVYVVNPTSALSVLGSSKADDDPAPLAECYLLSDLASSLRVKEGWLKKKLWRYLHSLDFCISLNKIPKLLFDGFIGELKITAQKEGAR